MIQCTGITPSGPCRRIDLTMPRDTDFPDWLLWLLRHPLLTIFVCVAVVLGIPAMIALYLDYRIASLEQQRTATVASGDDASGAVPSELPRDIVAGPDRLRPPLLPHLRGRGTPPRTGRHPQHPQYRFKARTDDLGHPLLRHQGTTRPRLPQTTTQAQSARLDRIPRPTIGYRRRVGCELHRRMGRRRPGPRPRHRSGHGRPCWHRHHLVRSPRPGH